MLPLFFRPACWPEMETLPKGREQARWRGKRQQAAALQSACCRFSSGQLAGRKWRPCRKGASKLAGAESGSKLPHSKAPAAAFLQASLLAGNGDPAERARASSLERKAAASCRTPKRLLPLFFRPACWPEMETLPKGREQARSRGERQQAAALQSACCRFSSGQLAGRKWRPCREGASKLAGAESGSKLPHSKAPAISLYFLCEGS